ncbi:aconitate hydratase AcnA [Schleiferia thermophila]|jgi:aconitate hydratase|uniref:Aconitate hydratase n=1 Tax=Schleiferia thermophila TaxID=884107 RepID=A0A369A5W7_9FLAO|nr:aconitate hydratase AcnA [Schleiferia thermophila]KFD38926.1 aconitate hydratase [Schleiferia thermophila str. Yellowstone]RCX03736.1 aconitase [Schleiferia thermophila]GCD79970.1 aconitate hydratase A [Schleiferia thermophila]
MSNNDIFGIVRELHASSGKVKYYSLKALEEQGYKVSHLPYSIRILLENALRNYDDFGITRENISTILNWAPVPPNQEIPFKPGRVLMQDFTGVPAVVDIASIRDEVARRGKDPDSINPLIPVDLIIDHSVIVDYFGTNYAFRKNVEVEYQRNRERYQLLKWAQKSFKNFSVVPPGSGICHQVNLEYLATGVTVRDGIAFPDTLVGTDSHTPMVNGIGVVAWGVGGIEAEAALLGQPIYFITPEVVGLKLTGALPVGTTATDLVLTITELLRRHKVVGKFVEVFGPGLSNLTVPDRATISNMSPEFGCTITYFPIDDRTLEYMRLTNRSEETIKLVEDYCKSNMLWRDDQATIQYSQLIELDLSTIEPTVSGPKRPQDKILLKEFKEKFIHLLETGYGRTYLPSDEREEYAGTDVAVAEEVKTMKTVAVKIGTETELIGDGSVVIAAITSCTNTSNPSVMIGAGILARKARERGLNVKPWVKTSLAPGSKVVTDYLERSGLLKDLEALRFHVVGYGCTSCIGNSGPLPAPVAKAIDENNLVVASVLSGNRNFEARVHPQVKMNFLMSPILVVAYAIAGRVDIDLNNEPIGYDPNLEPVYLKDIWPSEDEIRTTMTSVITPEDFRRSYSTIFEGDEQWKALDAPEGKTFRWDPSSTYIKEAPFFKDLKENPDRPADIVNSKVLLWLGDSVTTDHISPAGSFKEDSAAGKYLLSKGVEKKDFNSYGSRRGNDEVMVRGTFANVRIKNRIATREGGYSVHLPTGIEDTVFDTAMRYKAENTPLIVLAGKEYGSGSSRDWAAKGTYLLGIKAVIAESYERIHRSNLVGMGVMPLQFLDGQNADSLGLTGRETFTITGISEGLEPGKILKVIAKDDSSKEKTFEVICRLDSKIEIEYYTHGGILQYVLRQFLAS